MEDFQKAIENAKRGRQKLCRKMTSGQIVYYHRHSPSGGKGNSKMPKGQTEIVKSKDKQDYGQQNETKDKHST